MGGRRATKQEGPDAARVIRVWRSNGIHWNSIRGYRQRIRLFREYCIRQGKIPEEELRWEIVRRWASQYSRTRGLDTARTKQIFHSALWAWSWGLQACGYDVPPWTTPPCRTRPLSPLQKAFARHCKDVKGVAESTIERDLNMLREFSGFMRSRGRRITAARLVDIDKFLAVNGSRLAPKTLARLACALRSFFRFLYTSGRIAHNLADSIATPRVRRNDYPPRALPWPDGRRILKAIDKKTRTGRRDYALLLMMAVYGLGSGEVRGLMLENVDWRRRQLHVVRPKTGRDIWLPLLPRVARALAAYLRSGRPRHCTTRSLFVQMRAPYGRLKASSAVRHILHKHALAAGVSAPFLGSHVLRHSHATRQIDQGASPTIVGDILGHRRPESTSAYVRVALRRLRAVSLPVPR